MASSDSNFGEEIEFQRAGPLSAEPIEKVRLEQEAEWAQRAIQGDQEALGKLYECYVDRIYRYFYHKVGGDISEAQTLTSETFKRVVEALARRQYEWRGIPFGAWLFGIASRTLKEWQRGGQQTVSIDQEGFEHHPAVGEKEDILKTIVAQEEQDTLWQLVGQLSPDEQRVVIMCHQYGMHYAEIAPLLKRSESACKQLHYRALRKLKQKAIQAGLGDEIGKREEKMK
jgi:RNA polymerase sigma-70 factor (ECF subfamily)